MILLMKPFVIGDYIVQGNTEGTVKEIGLVYTELITADNRLIVIPNGTLIDSSIVNVTATGKRRLELSVGIGYKSDLKKAKEVLTVWEKMILQEIRKIPSMYLCQSLPKAP